MLPFSTHIGWGMGYDIVTAHQNALRAIRESAGDPQRYTYMLNENQEMVGPLCGDRTISYQLKPSARTNHIAKVLGISAINLEKMISLQEKRNMTEFSASDLVFYLDVTPRSATRILKKLVDYGAASKVDSVNLNGRGRPAAIYEIDFNKIRLE
jgi:predicted transcriptional regulator